MQGWPARSGRDVARRLPALERFRLLQSIRAVAVLLVVLCTVLTRSSMRPPASALWLHADGLPGLVGLTAAMTVTAALAAIAVARRPTCVTTALRGLVVADAVYLTVGTYLTGSQTSPLWYGVLLHVGAVTLLVSARTGLTLAVLDTVFLLALRGGEVEGWWPTTSWPQAGPPTQQLMVLLVVLWIVAVATSTLVVVNQRELRRRHHDLEALSLLTERVERAARPAAVAQLLLDAVVSTYGLRRGVVVSIDGEVDADVGAGSVLAASDLTLSSNQGPGTSDAIGRAHAQDRTVQVRLDRAKEPWLSRLLPGAQTVLVVPLLADSRPLGALVVEPAGSSRHQQRLVAGLERSSAYGALALRNASLMETVQRMAATDPLTRIANRRAFEHALDRELARATRAAEYVSLVMVDIDHFKELNDRLGHQGGDAVLRSAAEALADACREFDTPARYGGEEFAVILPGCGPDQAAETAERLRQAVCVAGPVPITASAGVATYPAHAGDTESLVGAADEALYVSKRTGRDRTTVSPGIGPEEQVNALIRRAVRERLRARDEPLDDPALEWSRPAQT